MPPAPSQRTARIAGVLFILTFLTSIPALLLYGPVLNHPSYITGGGVDTRIAVGAFLEIFLVITGVGTAVVLYPILKRYNESVALGYVATRIFESTIIAVGIVSVLSVVTLRHDVGGVGAVGSANLLIASRSLIAIHDWTFLIGPSLCAGLGNGLLLGYLLYKSGLVPRRLALIGVIGGPICFAAGMGALLGIYDKGANIKGVLTVPEIVWEASLGIYLTVKGFDTPFREPDPKRQDISQTLAPPVVPAH